MSPKRWLTAFAVAVIVGHHTGFMLEPLGEVGSTRWADWIDLALPYAVVGCAAGALAAAGAARRAWLVLGGAAILYTQGHGIHLAANSIANAAPGETAHLWDEVVGHYLWYAGLAGLVIALGLALGDLPRRMSPVSVFLALLFGFTVFTNSVEGGTALFGLAASCGFVAWGLRRRDRLTFLLVPAYGVAAAALTGWGVYWGGFPQFTELGWF